MTCIVSIETPEGVILGADSAVGSGWFTQFRGAKLARVADHLFAFAGDVRAGDLVRHTLRLLPPPKKQIHRHVVSVVVPALRECLKAGALAITKESAEQTGGASFLLGVRGQLFEVATDYSVCRAGHGYMAGGCGREIAAGALASTHGQEPRQRLRAALEAAERHSLGVRRPFRFLAERPT